MRVRRRAWDRHCAASGQQVVLSSKFSHPFYEREARARASRSAILESLRGSLKRLETDYLDVYMLHQPDPRTPMEETLDTLALLVRRELIRYFGFSNLPAWQATEAVWLCLSRGYPAPVCLEHRYNLLTAVWRRTLCLSVCGMGWA
jgi:aryl-alcohol dehydrogenase-like predicted oxidoreductase